VGPRAAGAALALLLASGALAQEPRVHVVQRGDTLGKIAERWLGDSDLWPALYRANRDRIKDPSRIYPGQRLSIPEPGAAESAADGEGGARGGP
jgi:nucleoid-associated protein YgaU